LEVKKSFEDLIKNAKFKHIFLAIIKGRGND
jgi:adenine-specific DNA methylase